MTENPSLVNIGELSKPATVLIEKISDAVGGIAKPWQIRRVAKAEAEADKIKAIAHIEIDELLKTRIAKICRRRSKETKRYRRDNSKSIAAS